MLDPTTRWSKDGCCKFHEGITSSWHEMRSSPVHMVCLNFSTGQAEQDIMTICPLYFGLQQGVAVAAAV